jgi:hypothetical protein
MTMNRICQAALMGVVAVVLLATGARAHEGENHDARPPEAMRGAAASASVPLPSQARLSASSETFELVGVLQGRTLTLWLDRFADNTPVVGARLRMDIAGQVIEAAADGEVYRIELPTAIDPGSLPVVATIVTPDTSDLLTAELLVPKPGAQPPAPDGASAPDAAVTSSRVLLDRMPASALLLGAATAILTGVIGWLIGRRRSGAKS